MKRFCITKGLISTSYTGFWSRLWHLWIAWWCLVRREFSVEADYLVAGWEYALVFFFPNLSVISKYNLPHFQEYLTDFDVKEEIYCLWRTSWVKLVPKVVKSRSNTLNENKRRKSKNCFYCDNFHFSASTSILRNSLTFKNLIPFKVDFFFLGWKSVLNFQIIFKILLTLIWVKRCCFLHFGIKNVKYE